jgi:asparagine synthase (glutamine-hydrolysing)
MPVVFSARSGANGYKIEGPPMHSVGADQVFARWHWNGEQLVVENDRWGVQPIFWAATPNAVHVSPSLDALLDAGVPAAVDDAALAVFLRIGCFVGNDTPFLSIRALPPAARLTWSREGVQLRTNASSPVAAPMPRAEAAAQFARLFTESVERSTTGGAPSAVLLNAGHDSRHILFALQELQRLPKRCVTVEPYAPSPAGDVALAAAVANAVGVRHTVVSRRSDRVEAQLETQALTHSCTDKHVQLLPLRGYLQHLQFHALDGLGGEVLSQSQHLDGALHRLFAEGRANDVAARVLGDPAQIEPALAGLIGPAAVLRFARDKALTRVAGEAGAHMAQPNPIASFLFANRIRRETALAPYGVLDGCRVSTPFLDAALVDFLLALPFDAVADRRLHTDTLHRHYPQHARIPFDSPRRESDDRRAVRRDATDLLKRVSESRSGLVHRTAVAARLLKAIASGASRHLWFLPRVLHLLEVERRARGEASATAATRAA